MILSSRWAAWACVCLLAGALCGCPGIPAPQTDGLYAVAVERGIRNTAAGDRVRYALYLPQPTDALPSPPWPAVVLLHGFARSIDFHTHTARYLAQRGFVVLTPMQSSPFFGDAPQQRNVVNFVEHVDWLKTRAATPGDPLFGRVAADRIALAGHSAGGAIAFEAAVALQQRGEGPAALFLLDAVPWESTIACAANLEELPMAAPRSEPAPCNAWNSFAGLRSRLGFNVEDVRIVGATHCDAENPTDLLCVLACGGTTRQGRAAYRDLFYAFLAENLAGPLFSDPEPGYEETLDALRDAGTVAR